MITDISYVSIAVTDIDAAIEDFRRSYGLEEVSAISYNRGYGWLRVLLGAGPEVLLELLQPTDSRRALGRYIQARGEAPYLVSFTVDDLAAAIGRLAEHGVRHTVFPPGARPERARIVWTHPRSTTGLFIELTEHLMENELTAFGPAPSGPPPLLRQLSYAGALVRDLEAAARLYVDALAFEVTEPRRTNADYNFERIVVGARGRGLLELMQPNEPGSAMGRHLERRGEGLYFACFLADDLKPATDTLTARGVAVTADRYGGWVHPRENHGLLVNLAEEHLSTPA